MSLATSNKKHELHPLLIAIIVMILMIVSYLALIHTWNATSNEYLPTDKWDSQVKTPSDKQDWFERRQRGL